MRLKLVALNYFQTLHGTFCNFSHESICRGDVLLNDTLQRSFFDRFYNKFRQLQEKAAKKLEFIITTGRNRQEYNYFIGKIKQQGKDIPIPQRLITRDGADIYYCSNNLFDSDNVDLAKRSEIHKLTNGWDGRKIKETIKQIIAESTKERVHFIDAPVNKHEYDYGEISLEYILNSLEPQKRESFASFRDDGELSFHITGSSNINFDQVAQKLKEHFSARKINAAVFVNEQDYNAIIPVYDHDNRQLGLTATKSLMIRPVINDGNQKALTKLFDLRKAVKEVIQKRSDDLVVIAGDDVNDIDCLNPLNYVDLIGLSTPKPNQYDDFIKQHRREIQSLPIVSIVAGDNPKLHMLRDMADKINAPTVKKIISIDNTNVVLADGIKDGITSYAGQNANFASNLPKELQSYLGIKAEHKENSVISLFKRAFAKETSK